MGKQLPISLLIFASIVGAAWSKPLVENDSYGIMDIAEKGPIYSLGADDLVIDHALAIRTDWKHIFRDDFLAQSPVPGDCWGRNMERPSVSELLRHLRTDIAIPGPAVSMRTEVEGFYNLWAVREAHAFPDDNVVGIGFQLETETNSEAFLGLACDYETCVFVNGAPVYARAGYDMYRGTSDLVPIHLNKGPNHIVVIYETREAKIFRSYYARSWMARVEVFKSADSARRQFIANNNRLVETPLVSSPHALVARCGAPFFSGGVLSDMFGGVIAHCDISPTGEIHWRENVAQFPSICMLSLDGAGRTPIVFTKGRQLEATAEEIYGLASKNEVAVAWKQRLRHLMKDEYKGARGSYVWCSKFVTAAAGSLNGSEHLLESGDIKLGSFTSKIDRSSQYHLFYNRENSDQIHGRVRRLVVFAPPPSAPVRPFLESTVLAAQNEYENWCSLAAELDCALLWPGYNNVDYSGPVSVAQLKENISEFCAQHCTPDCQVVVFGSCAAAGSAIMAGYTNDPRIDGVLLYSPILHRWVSRFSPGLSGGIANAERMVGSFAYDVSSFVEVFRNRPGFIIYDSAIPGHGSREDTNELLRLTKTSGFSVEEISCPQVKEGVSGERMKYRLRMLLTKAFSVKRREGGAAAGTAAVDDDHISIKESLLRGFTIDPTDQGLNGWLDFWERSYTQWRGCPLPRANDQSLATRLRTEELSRPDILLLADKLGFEKIADFEGVFGVYRERRNGHDDVVVFKMKGGAGGFPEIDPLIDGDFESAIYTSKDGQWTGKFSGR